MTARKAGEKPAAGITVDDAIVPESTGAVEFDGPPYTHQVVEGDPGESTGAVEYQAPGTTDAPHHGADPEVRVPTDSEPVTTEVGWVGQAQAKVVSATPSAAEPVKSRTARTK